MNRGSDRSRVARALLSATFVFALCVSIGASAQEAESNPAADAAATHATDPAPADQPRRGRDRRRNAETGPPAAEQTAAATAVADSGTEQPAETVEAETRLVCKNIKRIGTRVAQRVCGTPEQWAANAKRTSADAQEGFRQMRERSAIAGPIDSPLSTSD